MSGGVLWLSDIHLSFLTEEGRRRFVEAVAVRQPVATIITGDIADGETLGAALSLLAGGLPGRTYFVLGNHDFYGSSIAESRRVALAGQTKRLCYLTGGGVISLAPDLALVGHDGWADGRNGDFLGTRVEVNDFRLIRDLKGLSRFARYAQMAKLADAAADHFRRWLPRAASAHRRVLVATHVPPFALAAFHEGRPSAPDYLPFFSNRSVGEALLDVADAYPECRFTVLCGHTHGAGVYSPRANVEVRVAPAEYGAPAIAGVLSLEA